MLRVQQITLPVDHDEEALRRRLLRELRIEDSRLRVWRVFRRAVDARKKEKGVRFSYTLLAEVGDEAEVLARAENNPNVDAAPDTRYRVEAASPEGRERPLIVGTGPCGLFAALLLAEQGRRPILLERGKEAGPRARDVTRFWREGGELDPDSNVQFGEGGAGTFSDGKLYTGIRDRENRIRWILERLVEHGAPKDILVNAKPHIGTDKLIKVVRNLRERIIELGGEFHFGQRVTDLHVETGVVRGVTTSDGREWDAGLVILAVGHSARDVFEMLHRHGIPMEAKPFSVGVRIEHPQRMIDRVQYGRDAGKAMLGSADYKFVQHCGRGKGRRSAYSFCMCPGGLVVAAASETNRVVTNGMSSYARDDANANSGFMIDVMAEDFGGEGPLAGVEFQRKLERTAFELGGGDYRAPAQLLGDFMANRGSKRLGKVEASYRPGVTMVDLRALLPGAVVNAMQQAVPRIARRLPGFDMPDAVLTGVETRSSSPLRVLRDESLQCPAVQGLYPAGEGAGYAGGIISAAVDGMRVAETILA